MHSGLQSQRGLNPILNGNEISLNEIYPSLIFGGGPFGRKGGTRYREWSCWGACGRTPQFCGIVS